MPSKITTFEQAILALAKYVEDTGSAVSVADAIGCGKGHLSHVLAGNKTFGLKYALVVQGMTGIPAIAWERERENARPRKKTRRASASKGVA